MCSINHDLKAIFIHIPKTAGTYLADVLHKKYGFKNYYLTRPDHISFCKSFDNSIKSHENKIHGTLMYYKTSPYCNKIMNMTPEKWDSYYKFCFIRNPYDKIISGWNYVNREHITFPKYLQQPFQKNCWDFWHVFMPQVRHIINEKGKIGVDFIGKYENLEEDFQKILNHLHLQKKHHSFKKNSKKHLPFFLYYNQSSLEKVNKILHEDFTQLKDFYPTFQELKEFQASSASRLISKSSSSSSLSISSPKDTGESQSSLDITSSSVTDVLETS